MSNLLRRLRKLEAQLTDHSGLVPHTKPWRDYWSPRIEGLMTGEVVDQKIPFEVIDTLIHGVEVDGHGEQAGRYDEADQQTS
jgi:hypothetical protein